MPYSANKYPDSWKNEPAEVRAKAVEMVNAMLREGMAEDKAIPMALAGARKAMMGKKEMAEHANAIRGVEIFAPGTHNGDTYVEQDIDDMVAAHAELDFRPAIKIGHSKDSPGAPAYGWVTNLRKAGGKLVADFESMHDSVINAIKDQRYSRISSEVYFNLKRGGKSFRRALKAVALLGADVPAVAGLTPLHKMEFAADGFDSVATCEQALDVQQQAIIDSLTERVASLQEANEALALEREIAVLEDQVADFGEGKWVTINGRHIQIKDGEDLAGAMKREGLSKKPGDAEGKLKKEPSAKKIIRSITGIKNAGTNISIELKHIGKDPATATKSDVLDAMQKAVERWKTAMSSGPDAKEPAMQRVGREYIDTYQKIISKVNQFSEEEQDAMTIKELQEKKAALEAKLAAMKKENADENAEAIAKFEQELAGLGTQIKTLGEAAATNEENQRLRAQVSLLMEKDRAREVTERVAKCKIPAFHADLEAIYGHALASPAVKVKHFAVKDGKRIESEKTITEVVDSLVAHINTSSKKLFEVVTDGGNRQRAEGPSGDDAGREIDQKAKARLRDGKSKDYAEAMEAVLAAEPELAARYNEQQAAGRQA